MSGQTILVVDDNELLRFTCRLALERAGYTVVVAEDGLAALALAQRHLPSLVLMDLQMPVMTGWQAVRGLALDARTGEIPVIAHTADPAADTRQLRDAGFRAHIDKMAGTQRMVELVRRVLDRPAGLDEWIEPTPADADARRA